MLIVHNSGSNNSAMTGFLYYRAIIILDLNFPLNGLVQELAGKDAVC